MDVFIDNDEFTAAGDTLESIIAAARREVAPSGRIIVEVRLDGRTVPESDLPQYEPMLPDAQELQLITACPFDLSLTTLTQARQLLRDAQAFQRDAADAAATDDTASALNHVRHSLAAWQQVQEAVKMTSALLALPLDELRVGEQPAAAVIDELAVALAHVREQLVSSDWIALGDTMRYELDQAAGKWQALIDVLSDEIEKRGEARRHDDT